MVSPQPFAGDHAGATAIPILIGRAVLLSLPWLPYPLP